MAQKEKENKGKGIILSIAVIVAVVLIILGFSLFSQKNTGEKNNKTSEEGEGFLQDETSQGETGAEEIPELTEHVVNITIAGFVPKTLKIKKGDKVTWISQIVTNSWVAGDVHPTHTTYPGSSAIKCGTVEEKNIFDSCREFQKGESYSFVFNEVGEWGYHNHLNPSKDAKVIVEE